MNIAYLFNELVKGNMVIAHEDVYTNAIPLLNYALENGRLEDYKKLLMPRVYNDGVFRILIDGFSLETLKGEFEEDERLKGLYENLFEIDYEQIKTMRIKDTLPRAICGIGRPIKSEKDIMYYAEPACLEALTKLYNLNIKTISNDTGGVVGEYAEKYKTNIIIDADFLSEENKKIVERLIAEGNPNFSYLKRNCLEIKVPNTKEETVAEVSSRMMELVNKFVMQDVVAYKLNEVPKLFEKIIRTQIDIIYTLDFFDKINMSEIKELFINYVSNLGANESPFKDKLIEKIKVADGNDLYKYYKQIKGLGDLFISWLTAKYTLDEKIEVLKEEGYYFALDKELIFESPEDYEKHLKYLEYQERKPRKKGGFRKTDRGPAIFNFSEILGKSIEEIKYMPTSFLYIDDSNLFRENFDFFLRILSLNKYTAISSYSYEDLVLIENSLKEKTNITLSLLDDFQNKPRGYIKPEEFQKAELNIPLSYCMWLPEIKGKQRIYGYVCIDDYGTRDISELKYFTSEDYDRTYEIVSKIHSDNKDVTDELGKHIIISDYLQSRVQFIEKENISHADSGIYLTDVPLGYQVQWPMTILNKNVGVCEGIGNANMLLGNNPIMNLNIRCCISFEHVWCVGALAGSYYVIDNTWNITRNKDQYTGALKAKSFSSDYLLIGSDTLKTLPRHDAFNYVPPIIDTSYDRKKIEERVKSLSLRYPYNKPIYDSTFLGK